MSTALGHLLGRSGDADLAAQALAGLTGRLRDSASGGWVTSIDTAGESPDEKACYTHAFVVLAASSGAVAGLPGARDLLTEALDVWDQRFFDAAAGMFVDSWNRDFTQLDEYRGVNANMHAVEALLAAADVTGDHVLRARALGSLAGWRWSSLSRMPGGFPNTSLRAGSRSSSTTGIARTTSFSRTGPRSGTVWSGRDCCCISRRRWPIRRTGCCRPPRRCSIVPWSTAGRSMVPTASSTPPIGTALPVVRDRMHWVVAEAIAAAAALRTRTGEDRYAELAATWWAYAERYLFDRSTGPGTTSSTPAIRSSTRSGLASPTCITRYRQP